MRYHQIQQYLKENVIINDSLKNYINYLKTDIKEYLNRLINQIGIKHPRDNRIFTQNDYDETIKHYKELLKDIYKESNINLNNCKKFIEIIKNKLNVTSYVSIGCNFYEDKRKWPYKQVSYEPITSFVVYVNNLDFTISLEDNEYKLSEFIEDKEDLIDLNAKDEIIKDYYEFIKYFQNPNYLNELEKIITVYTARPTKDRELYLNKQIPTGIFVTTSVSEAEGYAAEFGNRDIFKIWVKKKYLVNTLNVGYKNYFLSNNDKFVPIEKILQL